MVRIGIVGIGFMGVTHFKAIDKVKELVKALEASK